MRDRVHKENYSIDNYDTASFFFVDWMSAGHNRAFD